MIACTTNRQSCTGALTARMSRGFNGQDAMNGMLVIASIRQGGGVASPLDASYYKGTGNRNGKEREFIVDQDRKYCVRRLTPLECCRLQGFPDWWTDGVEGSDSAKYKMWGNGMALPCVLYVMEGIKEALTE